MVNNYCNQINIKKTKHVGLRIKDKLKLLVAITALNKKRLIPIIYPEHPNILLIQLVYLYQLKILIYQNLIILIILYLILIMMIPK